MKKILLVVDEFLPISSAQAIRIHSFAKILKKEYEIDILCGEQNPSQRDILPNVRYTKIKRPLKEKPLQFLYYFIKFNQKIIQQIKKKRYDLVVITIPRYEFLYAINKLKKYKTPYILDIRDLLINTNYELIFQRFLPKFLAKNLAKMVEKKKKKILKKAILNSKCTTVAYPGLYSYYTKSIPQAKEKIQFIPNGVDLSYFPEKKNNWTDPKLNILYIGNFHEKDLLKEIITELNKCKEKRNISLTLVGKGREKNHLILLIQKYQLEQNIFLKDRIHHSEVYKLAKEADIGIILRDRNIPTLLPVSLVEYMAMGIPVIVNNYSELGDFVRQTKSGYIIEDISELHNLLDSLINQKKEFKDIGAKNREWIENFGDRNKIAKDFKEKIINKYIYNSK